MIPSYRRYVQPRQARITALNASTFRQAETCFHIGWAAERFELSIPAYLAGMIPVREFYVAFQHAIQITIQLLRNVSENSASIAVKERPWSVYSESNHVAPAFGSAPAHAERTICLDRSFGRDEHRFLIIPRIFIQSALVTPSDVPESAHSCASPSSRPFQRLQFCLQLFNPFTMRRPRKNRNRGGAATFGERLAHFILSRNSNLSQPTLPAAAV